MACIACAHVWALRLRRSPAYDHSETHCHTENALAYLKVVLVKARATLGACSCTLAVIVACIVASKHWIWGGGVNQGIKQRCNMAFKIACGIF